MDSIITKVFLKLKKVICLINEGDDNLVEMKR